MQHKLPDLPFKPEAVAGWISQETLDFHHGRHHRDYVDKLNSLLPGSGFETATLSDIVTRAQPGPLFNNAAQAWNHTFFWLGIAPEKQKNPLKKFSNLRAELADSFGSLETFQKTFSSAANTVFGSGWIWLVKSDRERLLKIMTTKDGDNPMRQGYKPLLTCDLWEHAYYIDYRNDRHTFVDGFLRSINWAFVDQNLKMGFAEVA